MEIRLVYASAATQRFDAPALEQLLKTARSNNTRLHISGLLLHHEGSFLQVLEGEEQAVLNLFKKISADPRHDRVLMLGRFPIEERAFGDWSMGSLELSRKGGAPLEGLSDFLRGGVLVLEHDEELVQKLLSGFRDGRYRQHLR